MAIREALGEAKAKERTVEVQTFVKKYLADAVEMKRGRDLGTHGFEHQELYLFPRESFAQTASAYAKARTANAIGDPAERDADGGNAAEDDRDGDALVRRRERTAVASIVHRAPVKTKGATVKAPDPARAPDPGPLSKRPRTADDASAYRAIRDCVLSSRDGTLCRVHVEGARHRANLAATRRTSPRTSPPTSRADLRRRKTRFQSTGIRPSLADRRARGFHPPPTIPRLRVSPRRPTRLRGRNASLGSRMNFWTRVARSETRIARSKIARRKSRRSERRRRRSSRI